MLADSTQSDDTWSGEKYERIMYMNSMLTGSSLSKSPKRPWPQIERTGWQVLSQESGAEDECLAVRLLAHTYDKLLLIRDKSTKD